MGTLSPYSNDFQELTQTFRATGDKEAFVKMRDDKGITPEEYDEAYGVYADLWTSKGYRDQDFSVGENEGLGKGMDVLSGIVGETASDAADLWHAVTPDFMSKWAREAGEGIGTMFSKETLMDLDAAADPYFGVGSLTIDDALEEQTTGEDEWTGAGFKKGLRDVGTWAVPSLGLFKAGKAGIKGYRLAKSLASSPAQRAVLSKARKKYAEAKYLSGMGLASAAGATMSEGLDESHMLDWSEEDDSDLTRYGKNFVSNLALEGALVPATIVGGKLLKAGLKSSSAQKVLGKVHKSKPIRWSKEWLKANRNTDDAFAAAAYRRDNAGAAAMDAAEGIEVEFRKSIKDGYKAQGKPMPKDFYEDTVNLALNGDAKAMSIVNGVSKGAGKLLWKMRNNIDNNTSAILRDDIVGGKLAISMDKNKGTYLNISYDVFDNQAFKKKLAKRIKNPDVNDKVVHDAMNWVKKYYGTADQRIIQDKLLKLIKADDQFAAQDILDSITGKNVMHSTSDIFKGRAKVPKVIQNLYGKSKNPFSNYGKTMEKMAKIQAEYRFLDEIKDNLISSGIAKAGIASSKVSQKTGKHSKRLGYSSPELDGSLVSMDQILEGRMKGIFTDKLSKGDKALKSDFKPHSDLAHMYVDPSYARVMRDGLDVKNPNNPIAKWWLMGKSLTQKSKTIYNPATHVGNTVGQVTMLAANGMLPIGKKAYKDVAKKITSTTDEALGLELAELQRLGVVDSGTTVSMIKQNMGQFGSAQDKYMRKRMARRVWDKSLGWADKKLMQAYQAEDDTFKMIHYMKSKDYLAKAYPKMADADRKLMAARAKVAKSSFAKRATYQEEVDRLVKEGANSLEKMASQRTRDLMPNYGQVSKLVQAARMAPFGDFISFPAEMIRTSKNLIKYTMQDARSGNPHLVEAASKRLAGMTTVGMMPTAMAELSRVGNDISATQDEDIRHTMPNYQAYSNVIYDGPIETDKKTGHRNVPFFKTTSLDPFDYVRSAGVAIHSAIAADTDVDLNKHVWGLVENQIMPFTKPSMLTRTILDGVQGKGFDKLEQEAQTSDQLGFVLGLAGEPFEPGFVRWWRKRADTINKDGFNKYAAQQHPESTGVAAMFGLAPRNHDLTAAFNWQLGGAKRKIKDSMDPLHGILKEFHVGDSRDTQEDMLAAYYNGQMKKLEGYQDLKTTMDAYRNLGFNDGMMVDAMNIGRDFNSNLWDHMSLARENVFSPDPIDSDLEITARKGENKLPMEALIRQWQALDGAAVFKKSKPRDTKLNTTQEN